MITVELDNFSLREICQSGQCFRMRETAEKNTYELIAGDKYLKASQEGSIVNFFCSDMEFICYWVPYFDIDVDYGKYIQTVNPRDSYLNAAVQCGSGIRILHQDLWEMIITFIISQQKTIPAIRALVEALSEKYGTRYELSSGYYYAFPTPEELNHASLDELLALKLGYRAKYIKRTCEDVCSGKMDLDRLRGLNYSDSMEALLSCYGIGVKVANCICLFGLHHIDAFPVDTWIKKILLREYAPKSHCTGHVPETRLCEMLIEENFSKYPGFAGVLQQYIFFYEREFSRKALQDTRGIK